MTAASQSRWWLALLACASAAFTLLGSLVPFEFNGLSFAEARQEFVTRMTPPLRIASRSDFLANVMLGVPLGFALLGVLCVDRAVAPRRAAGLAVLVLLACLAFPAAVEFAQLFAEHRMCTASDVLAQTLGATLGIIGWMLAGQRLTEEVRKAATGTGSAERFLAAYVLLLGFVQALPLDLSLSPADAYRKLRDGGMNAAIPFGEFRTLSRAEAVGRLATLLKLAGLYLPVGLLAAQVPYLSGSRDRSGTPAASASAQRTYQVLLLALALAAFMEAGQVLVKSRSSSATDVVIGGLAVLVGWRLCKSVGRHGVLLVLAACLGLLAVNWQPFEFGPPVSFEWIPGLPFEGGNPLFTLEDMLTKLVLFGLLGAAIQQAGGPERGQTGRVHLRVATLAGFTLAVVIELGQTRFVGHTPGITDVLLGGLGTFCGAWVAGKVRRG